MSRTLEYWYPRLAGGSVAILYLVFFRKTRLGENWHDIFNAALTLASITVGFLVTASATLLSVQDSNVVIRRAKRAGAYRDLIEYLISGARWNFGAAIVSAACLLIDSKQPAWWHFFVFGVWLGIIVTAALTITRIFKLFILVLRLNADPE